MKEGEGRREQRDEEWEGKNRRMKEGEGRREEREEGTREMKNGEGEEEEELTRLAACNASLQILLGPSLPLFLLIKQRPTSTEETTS